MSYTPEQKRQAVERTFFPVEKIENTGQDDCSIVNSNSGRVISNVSKRYTLIPNRRLVEPIGNKLGWDKLTGLHVWGKNYQYTFNTGREIEISENDRVKERLLIGNSYDKTKSFSFMFGAFRMVCSNGMFTGQAIVAYKKIHVGYIPVDEIVNKVLDSYQSNQFDLWRDFAKHPMTEKEELELVANFKAYKEPEEDKHKEYRGTYYENKDSIYLNRRIRERASEYVAKPESLDNHRSAWGLYNQINRSIARNYDLQGNSNYTKRVNGNLSAEKYIQEAIS